MKYSKDILGGIGKFVSLHFYCTDKSIISAIVKNYFNYFNPTFTYYFNYERSMDYKKMRRKPEKILAQAIEKMFEKNGFVFYEFTDATENSLSKNKILFTVHLDTARLSNIYIECNNSVEWSVIYSFVNSLITGYDFYYISSGYASMKNALANVSGTVYGCQLLMQNRYLTGNELLHNTLRFSDILDSYIDGPHIIQYIGTTLARKILIRELLYNLLNVKDFNLMQKLKEADFVDYKFVNDGILINIDFSMCNDENETFDKLKQLNQIYLGYSKMIKKPLIFEKKYDWLEWSKRFN